MMTLFQALSQCEEFNCAIVNFKSGQKIYPTYLKEDEILIDHSFPREGWELDEMPSAVHFEAEFLGCDRMEVLGGKKGAIYSFGKLTNASIETLMPTGTKVKVTLEPLA